MRYGHGHGTTPTNFPLVTFSRVKSDLSKFVFIRDLSEIVLIDDESTKDMGAYGNQMVLENAERLGLIGKNYGAILSKTIRDGVERDPYESLMYHEKIVEFAKTISSQGDRMSADAGYGHFTEFGRRYFSAVISD